MQTPVQVTFHGIEQSDFIEAYVRKRSAKLDTFHARITACRVTVEVPHQHQHHGRHFCVRIDVTVPGGEVVVSHAPDESAANEDVYAAIDESFDRLGRRLEDHVRRQRGDVKSREESYRDGRVTKLWSNEGYGFIETRDGDEVYFHRNSVLHQAFGRTKVGSLVRFVEEVGDKGPQASTVVLVGSAGPA
jgi:ribosomal subunit interface protein